uniref:Uncharacterized protein n=1 Tax=Favella ehrenbergii TaxID=182087 RepID=A0A7S3I6I4_9SPIT|mmetsp:Transcript_35891/g.43879  ORF Transcript_35891/g.43879 Transcript_35891/m.43879 type:complete len:101 (+) Transcript_35891:23-325(+)|eukprot:CAMPEP_0170469360 /NCGR_PEP_ID=MMETSP0123-20130129/12216_1 /TAXON_ID=182087 /ORGANISM="Favella ehrenbergii, Strain Fehren 1" /LENGTH=100 /DNA_ID=CAMNT_0010736203 /DNA_START=23 /DNA_END=325 /DNA_ORIENTATION=+
MSEDFGKGVLRPGVPVPDEKEIKAMYPEYAHLGNGAYNRLIKGYFGCVTKYLNDYYEPVLLEQQLNRRDLDTVCAYELYQMKKEFTTSNVLNMSNFVSKQ